MTDQDFCKIDAEFYGEEVDHIKQISLRSFTGEELKEYVEAAINYTRCYELLICLDNDNYEMLTNYKLYKLVSESKGYYNLYDDDGKLVQMSKVRFKKVVAN